MNQQNPKSDKQQMHLFIQLSSLLTGFSVRQLEKTGLKSVYLEHVAGKRKSAFDSLLENFEELLEKYKTNSVDQMKVEERQELGDALLHPSQPEATIQVALGIIEMWYLGSSYFEDRNKEREEEKVKVISSSAYTKGLAWRAMQSHAMGASRKHYGHWSQPPEDLSAFTGRSLNRGGEQ